MQSSCVLINTLIVDKYINYGNQCFPRLKRLREVLFLLWKGRPFLYVSFPRIVWNHIIHLCSCSFRLQLLNFVLQVMLDCIRGAILQSINSCLSLPLPKTKMLGNMEAAAVQYVQWTDHALHKIANLAFLQSSSTLLPLTSAFSASNAGLNLQGQIPSHSQSWKSTICWRALLASLKSQGHCWASVCTCLQPDLSFWLQITIL